jgi:large subunit ribosomal protein L5
MAEKKVTKQAAPAKGKKKDEKAVEETKQVSVEKEVRVPSRLGNIYKQEIVPALVSKFNYTTVMQVPRLDKIVLNMGVGEAVSDQKVIEEAIKTMEAITGQKSIVRKAKKAISNFKLREGMSIGVKTTLRRERMYEFLDRFINISLPRVRDFRGLSDKSFDGRGNYTLGIKEQIIFPEINVDKVVKILGMDITFVTTANTDSEAYELLAAFGLPFRKKN